MAHSTHFAARSSLPAGPSVPSWWQLVRFAGDPLSLLDECHARYGDAFTLNIAGQGRFVMLSDPNAVREVFQGDPEVLHSGEANSLFTATVGRHSVLVLDGPAHMSQRRVLVPPLKGERMRAFFEAMQLEALDGIKQWPTDVIFPTLPSMRRMTLRVIFRTGLGLAPGPELDRFEHKMEIFLSNGRQRYALVMMSVLPIERFAGSRWLPLFRQLSELDDDLFQLIRARRDGAQPAVSQNVLDDLLNAKHEDGTSLSDQEVRDAIITILIAGHETTALALSWAITDISEHPEVADRLFQELASVTGGGPPNAEHLPNLEYLDATIRESLRLHPIAPFVVRKTMKPLTVAGHEYPAGIVLCPCSYLVHRRQDLYASPMRFQPERFLERRYLPHEWFPFGGSNRICLGMPFALYEMKVLIATLLSQVHVNRPANARSRSRRYGIVLGPDDGGRVLVSPRRRPS